MSRWMIIAAFLAGLVAGIVVSRSFYRPLEYNIPPMPPSIGAPPSPPMPLPADFAIVRVFYATDRTRTASTKPAEMFGVGRAALSYGSCDVSIPRDHRMGELESPSIWRLDFREDPTKHVVLLSTVVSSKDMFII